MLSQLHHRGNKVSSIGYTMETGEEGRRTYFKSEIQTFKLKLEKVESCVVVDVLNLKFPSKCPVIC